MFSQHLDRRRYKHHVRIQRWLLVQQQPKDQAHLLGVNIAK